MLFESFMLFLTERNIEEIFEPNTNPDQYRVSSIPYCNRKAYFTKMGRENRLSNYLLQLSHEGKIHHLVAQADAKQYAEKTHDVEVEDEAPLEVSFNPLIDGKVGEPVSIRGSIDLLWALPNDSMEIVDVKSVASKGYYNTRNYGAYQSHIDQVLMYDWGFRKVNKPKKSPTTCLWYKNRNDGHWLEVRVPYDKDRVDFLIKKLCKLIYAVRNKAVPDSHSPMHDFECSSKSGRCSFYSICEEIKRKVREDEDND